MSLGASSRSNGGKRALAGPFPLSYEPSRSGGSEFSRSSPGASTSSLAAGPPAKRFQQRTLILSGFVTNIAGVFVLPATRYAGIGML